MLGVQRKAEPLYLLGRLQYASAPEAGDFDVTRADAPQNEA